MSFRLERKGRFDLTPFQTIWRYPQETVRWIIETNSPPHVVLLSCLAGVERCLSRAETRGFGETMSVPAILGLALILGPLAGLFGVWANAHLLRFTGKLLGGVGSVGQLRTAFAWGTAPSIIGLSLWVPKLLLGGSEIFQLKKPLLDAWPAALFFLTLISTIELLLAGWTLGLLSRTVTEVQGFQSAWSGLLNLILVGLAWVAFALATGFAISSLLA
ncbi:MAG: YIP1 family protein [Planctomycetota bacterium]|jgi:hypothetical protein